MNIKIFLTLAVSALVAIIAINIGIARLDSVETSSASLAEMEQAFGFEFNGTEWNTTDTHLFGSDWKPVLIDCTGYDKNFWGETIATWTGKKIQCQNGNGNCGNGTGCIGNPAN
jgi:hypothetical protein